MILFEIVVPLLNVNEPEARVAQVHILDKQAVTRGTLLFTLETTKATSEIESPGDGFIRNLVKEGDILPTGRRLGVICESADEPTTVDTAGRDDQTQPDQVVQGAGLRITKPARELAESLGMDVMKIKSDQLVTTDIVRQMSEQGKPLEMATPSPGLENLVIFGGGGHAKTIIDLIKKLDKYSIAGILDDDPSMTGEQVMGIRVLGTCELLGRVLDQRVGLAVNCVGGILDIHVRVRIFELLEQRGFTLPTLVHPQATVEESATIGKGIQVLCKAYIGSEATLDDYCLINTGSVVSHDCRIGKYTHIAPGVMLAGNVHVGEKSLIGMGVTTAVGIKIGSGVRIGNSAIVLADVPDHAIIQAGRFWVGKA